MSAARDVDTDNQSPTRFDHYTDLPAELRIKIIREAIAASRMRPRLEKLTPFVLVHSEWQHELEAEPELFGSLLLTTDDLPGLSSMLNQHRRNSLSTVILQVCIDNTAIDTNSYSRSSTGNTRFLQKVKDFIVESVAKVLESVDHIKSTCPHVNKREVDLHTHIMIPKEVQHGNLGSRLSGYYRLDCDFSGLLPAKAIRSFQQQDSIPGRKTGRPFSLSSTSLLTLVPRMANLRCATICLPLDELMNAPTTPQLPICRRLETLTIESDAQRLPGLALTKWTTKWGENIKQLNLCDVDDIPAFLRGLSTPCFGTGTTAWKNLQILKLKGDYGPLPDQVSSNNLRGGDSPSEVVLAMAEASVLIPNIREITIKLNAPSIRLPHIIMHLNLVLGSCLLTVSVMKSRFKKRDFWTVFPQDEMQEAVEEAYEVIQTHRGLELYVLWPERHPWRTTHGSQ